MGAWMELFEDARETEDSVMEGLLLRWVEEVVDVVEALEKKPMMEEEGGSESGRCLLCCGSAGSDACECCVTACGQ